MPPAPPSREWIDITRPLAAGIACWPGDVPFRFRLGWQMAAGAAVNVGNVTTSVHTGTHVDSPFHYDPAGATTDRLPVDVFVGPAWVADVTGLDEWKTALAGVDLSATPRVLFRTGGWPDDTQFPTAIPVMEADLPDWLAGRGVKLIGVDLPSVDPLDSKTLDRHHALGRGGIHILEGLRLDGVAVGRYELVALPLPLVGADGSPVRAVLMPMERG
jgi:arylformamidase